MPAGKPPEVAPVTFELCSRCAEKMNQAKAEGKVGIVLCGDCSLRRTAADEAERIASGSPPPWRWDVGDLGGARLLDANDDDILRGDMNGDLEPLAEGTAEVIRAAPEMATLLRGLVDLTRDGDQVRDNVGWICNLCDEAAALLARIDTAKGGG